MTIARETLLRRIRDGVVYRVVRAQLHEPRVGMRRLGGRQLWWVERERIAREFQVVPKGEA